MKVFLGSIVAFLVIVADQMSKYLVLGWLGVRTYEPLTSFFAIVRAWNTGVSFSMFNNYGNVGAYLLSLVAIIIVSMLLHWLKKEENRLTQVALGLIMGGALGNVIDRLRFGAVYDFLDVHVGDIHWPAFNLADSCICIGAAIIIIQSVVFKFVKRG